MKRYAVAWLGLALLGGCPGAGTAPLTTAPGGHENDWREAIELIADADGHDLAVQALRGHWSQAVRSALEAADAEEDGKLAELLAASRCTAMAATKLEHGLPDCGGGSCLIRGKSVPIGVSKVESEPQPRRWKGSAPPNFGPPYQTGAKIGKGWVLGVDHGHYGGVVAVLDEDGDAKVLLQEPVVDVFVVSGRAFILTSEGGLSCSKGRVYSFVPGHGLESIGELPAAPLGHARLEDGTVVLATEAGAIALSEGRLGSLE